MRRARLVASSLYLCGAAVMLDCSPGVEQAPAAPQAPMSEVAGARSGAPAVPPRVESPADASSTPAMVGAMSETQPIVTTTPMAATPSPAGMMGGMVPPAVPAMSAPAAPAVPIPSAAFAVSDLDKSISYYTDLMGMRVLGEVEYADRVEVVLAAKAGAMVFGLMKYTDGIARNTKNVPAKLLFGVSNVAEVAQRITAAGYTFQIEGIIANDPDGYGVELLEQPNTDRAVVAVGIFVSEFQKSIDFYVNGVGLVEATNTGFGGFMERVMLGGGLSHGILLLNWQDGVQRNYTDNPVKLTFAVPNAAAALMKVESAGQRIVSQPMPEPARANALVGVAKDPDGYLLEFVQR